MKCARCQHENSPGARFCEECAAPLARVCANCGASLSATAKFCSECAHPAGQALPAARYTSPEGYTPKHLAERILTSRSAVEGERKQVTVLFADLKGSMELLADRDPEEARKPRVSVRSQGIACRSRRFTVSWLRCTISSTRTGRQASPGKGRRWRRSSVNIGGRRNAIVTPLAAPRARIRVATLLP